MCRSSGTTMATAGWISPCIVLSPADGTSSNRAPTSRSGDLHVGLQRRLPVPGDYDGDGKTDLAVYRPSTGVWYILTSSSNYTTTRTITLGLSTDIPVPADYDGDGKTDVAVYRPSTGRLDHPAVQHRGNCRVPVGPERRRAGARRLRWRRHQSTSRCIGPPPASWFIRQSTTGFTTSVSFQWGLPRDVPVPGDYDGDGKTDLAVYRPATGTWYISQSTTDYTTSVSFQWGLGSDIPTPNGPIAYAMAAAASGDRLGARQPGARQRFRRRRQGGSHRLSSVHRHVVHPAVEHQLRDVHVLHAGREHGPPGHGRFRRRRQDRRGGVYAGDGDLVDPAIEPRFHRPISGA